MNILFVSMVPFENNTSATIQNKGIIKGFFELGHSVDIMTLEPKINALGYDEAMNDIKDVVRNSYYIELNPKYAVLMAKKHDKYTEKINEKSKNISIVNLKRSIRNLVKIIYDKIAIYDAQKSNVKQISKLEIDYDIYDFIVSASDPKSSHLIVDKIIKDNPNIRAKWIQYWGDPMFNDITRKSDWRDGLVKCNERKLIKKADRIVYASPITLKLQKETYPEQANKMDYANQVFLIDSVNNKRPNNINVDRTTLGYFGAYNSKIRNIRPLYDAVLKSEYDLSICGPSDAKLDSVDNIRVYGVVPYKQAIEMEEECDILVCICNSKGTQIPGKIYYCAGYDKPIIVVLDGEYKKELKAYFETFYRYILCENYEDSILEAIEEAKEQLKVSKLIIAEQLTPEYMTRKILGGIENNLN